MLHYVYMDIISHGLYGGVGFGRKSKRTYLVAFLFGILPDALSFGIYFILALFGVFEFGRMASGPPDPQLIPQFVYIMYDITHSFVIYALFALILYAFRRKTLLWLTLGWPLHILVDIPTHSNAFFPTPFLWPLSDFSVNGIPWSNPWIFFPNVALIITLYSYWWFLHKKKHHSR